MILEGPAALGDECGKVFPGGARFGAGVNTRRGGDGAMPQNATNNFILARPGVQEQLAAGMSEQVHIDLKAGIF